MELGNLIFGHSSRAHPVPRSVGFEDEIQRLFDVIDPGIMNSYGCEFVNDTFEVHTYWWGDCTCGADERDEEFHASTCKYMIPNFFYKPIGLEIEWYKYPFRDSYSNQPLALKAFSKIIDHCIDSYVEEVKHGC